MSQIHPAARSGGRSIVALLAEPVGGDEARKRAFKAEAMRLLKALAAALGLEKGGYDLRWNEGGPAVSGEATLHADTVYVQVSQTFCGAVLFRRCKGRRDYCGEANRWASAVELADPVGLADRIAHELHLASPPRDRLL